MTAWDELRSGPVRRWALCLTVGGLDVRYYDVARPPAGTAIDGTSGGASYVDRPGLQDIGPLRDSYRAEGGLADHAPHPITLATRGRWAHDAYDPGVVFGRLTRRSAAWSAQVLTPMTPLTTGQIEVDQDPTGLSYPRLMHIDGETVWATAATTGPYRITIGARGAARTPVQRHSVDEEYGDLPQITTEVVHWRTRWATIHAAPVYQDGSSGDWVELVHGFIDATPQISEVEVAFTLVPITAVLDVELAATRGTQTRTRLLQGYHFFAWPEAFVWEHAQYLQAVSASTGLFVSNLTVAGRLYCADATAQGLEAIAFDRTLPTGHPRRLTISTGGIAGTVIYDVVALGLDATGPYFITNPACPAGLQRGTRISMSAWEPRELRRYSILATGAAPGLQTVLQWPEEAFQAVSGVSPAPGWTDSQVNGLTGSWARLQLQRDKIILTADQLAPLGVGVKARLLTGDGWRYDTAREEPTDWRLGPPRGPVYPRAARIYYPLRIDLEDEDGVQSLQVYAGGPGATADMETALAWYQEEERFLLVEDDIPVPVGGTVPIRVKYQDEAGETQYATAEITASTAVTYGGAPIGYRLTIASEYVGRIQGRGLPDLGDWPGAERVEIIAGTSAERVSSAELMLRLLESGSGEGVNGSYDVGALGAGLPGNSATPAASGPWGPLRLVDEQSFLDVVGPEACEEWTRFVSDGETVGDLIRDVSIATGSIVCLQRRPDGTCRLRRIPISPTGPHEAVLDIQAGDLLARESPQRAVDDRIITRQRYQLNYENGEEAQTTVEIVDQRALHAHGEAGTLTVDLKGVDLPDRGGDAVQLALRGLFTRMSALLGDERLIWRVEISTAQAALLQLGSAVSISSPLLRGFSDEIGVTSAIARVKSIEMSLTGEGATLELLYYGQLATGFNAALQVEAAPSATRVQVDATEYSGGVDPHSGETITDLSYWGVGDAVRVVPGANHDAAILLTVVSILPGPPPTVELSGPHGLTGPLWGTLEPALYDSAPEAQQQLGYLADASETLGAGGDPGQVVS